MKKELMFNIFKTQKEIDEDNKKKCNEAILKGKHELQGFIDECSKLYGYEKTIAMDKYNCDVNKRLSDIYERKSNDITYSSRSRQSKTGSYIFGGAISAITNNPFIGAIATVDNINKRNEKNGYLNELASEVSTSYLQQSKDLKEKTELIDIDYLKQRIIIEDFFDKEFLGKLIEPKIVSMKPKSEIGYTEIQIEFKYVDDVKFRLDCGLVKQFNIDGSYLCKIKDKVSEKEYDVKACLPIYGISANKNYRKVNNYIFDILCDNDISELNVMDRFDALFEPIELWSFHDMAYGSPLFEGMNKNDIDKIKTDFNSKIDNYLNKKLKHEQFELKMLESVKKDICQYALEKEYSMANYEELLRFIDKKWGLDRIRMYRMNNIIRDLAGNGYIKTYCDERTKLVAIKANKEYTGN